MIARPVELDRVGGDQHKGWGGITVANGLPEIVQRLTQVLARAALGSLGPEEARQGLAAVRLACLDNQVGQHCSHLIRLESTDGVPVQRHLKRAQQGDG